MQGYINTGTNKTPTIKFDPHVGILEIGGRSIPEDPIEFYRPLIDTLTTYAISLPPKFLVTIQLEYFNTSSSRCIYSIFKKLETMRKVGSAVEVNWIFEEGDDEMLEVGEDFGAILDIPFNMLPLGR
ncbi:MAG: DUF1987 domain-containing protein [bacterium]|nr:DUF1987 domain-containing protein [bacterium]